MKVVIIGGGAAGFFAAIQAKENHPKSKVVLLEKSQKVLSKVKVSGGGRCNVTNGCTSIKDLSSGYPRGSKALKKVFPVFNNIDTQKWFIERGVELKTEADNRVFPVSNNSQTIIDCLLNEADRLKIKIEFGAPVQSIKKVENYQFKINFVKNKKPSIVVDKIIVATGGSPKLDGFNWLKDLGHKIESPVPSLFTFNMPGNSIKELMGVVVEPAQVSIQSTKLKSVGPVLITHWGMSGPAILKLSSFGARILSDLNYNFKVQVNWLNIPNNELIAEQLNELISKHPKKNLASLKPFNLASRFWLYIISKCELATDKKLGDLGKKGLNKLVNCLSNDIYEVKGKTTFKEEFVTCGGVSLESVNIKTMQSKHCKNLYFAGEVLDIDGITGGYNFQAAWTTGFIAGKLSD